VGLVDSREDYLDNLVLTPVIEVRNQNLPRVAFEFIKCLFFALGILYENVFPLLGPLGL
jgi:hypothetical protein